MPHKIDPNICIGCHACMGVCPVMTISSPTGDKCVIDPSKCIDCGLCAAVCPVGAIARDIPAAPSTPLASAPATPASKPA